ncbi:MAG TPA: chemotaxis protein CheW [Candidatus Polarisedimenticolia bacterium]|nr:chemotaxis protein CheW [Candidatus Polarisedimenticolia bacterium]
MKESNGACLRFHLGKETFGLPLEQVREIAVVDRVAPVPLAPEAILGVMNLRGRVITLLDVGRLVGRPLAPPRGPLDRLALVLAAPHEHLALYVHAPVEIGTAAPEAVLAGAVAGSMAAAAEDAGTAAPSAPAGLPAGSPEGMVQILSAHEVVARCEGNVVARFRRSGRETAA